VCRLYAFIANEPTKVDCSLVFAQNALLLQSRVDQLGRHHADGWGIAAYQRGTPRLIKNTTAAFDDQSFSCEAEKIYTTAAIAHVRKATVGVSSVYNTHPFCCGSWAFAHNGTVTGFEKIEAKLAKETCKELQKYRQGTTDSEQYFLWLLSRLQQCGVLASDFRVIAKSSSDVIHREILQSVELLDLRCREAALEETPKLNFVLTDGQTLVACRWNNSLHMIERHGIYSCEICGIPHVHHHETVDHHAFAFASEPITNEPWQEVTNESVFVAVV
jgi:glutamine amidotransferase